MLLDYSAVCTVGLEHMRQVLGSVQVAFLGASVKVTKFRYFFPSSNSISLDRFKSTLVPSYGGRCVRG